VNRRPRFSIAAAPGFVAAVLLLLANDHVLKPAFPGAVTGKLSDVSGLFVAGALAAAFAPSRPALALGGVGAAFVLWKSPLSQPLIGAWNAVGPWPIARVVDWTDLLALPALPLARLYARSRYRAIPARAWQPVMLGVTALAMIATSLAPRIPPSGVYSNDPASVRRYRSDATFTTPLSRADVLAAFHHAGFAVSYFRTGIDLNSRIRCDGDDSPSHSFVAAELTLSDASGRTEIVVGSLAYCERSVPESREAAVAAFEGEVLTASLPSVRRIK